ncbi:MAG: ABC transporter permease [Actinomycetota bacterium]|nr:ABC transporter permease [Actinomycetota bacterium]
MSPLALLALWEITAQVGLLDTRFFPPPTRIASQFVELVQSGELLVNTWVSLQRLFFGFLLGGIPALILGLIMGLYRPIRAAIDPLIAATYPIPKSAVLPLILLIFGLGEMSKIVMVAIGVFFPVVINTIAGVLEIDKIYHDVSKNFGASRWQVFRTVALPGAMPLIMTGVKLGIGLGLILIAIAEMVGAKSGIGYMIWNAWQIFSVETMYVGILVISVLGVLFTVVMNELEQVIIPWRRDR